MVRKMSSAVWALSAWLAVTGCGASSSDDSTGGPDGTMDTPTGDAIAAARPATSPTETPCIPMELSPAAVELVRLYEDLHTFKDDPEFLFFGFASGGPGSAWMQAIERHQDTNSGFELLDEVGFLPGELLMLGMNYMDEDVSDSELAAIEYFERKIQAGLVAARCTELDSVQETIQTTSEARRSYVADATEAPLLARERGHQAVDAHARLEAWGEDLQRSGAAMEGHLSAIARAQSAFNRSVDDFVAGHGALGEVRGQALRLERAIDAAEVAAQAGLALLDAPPLDGVSPAVQVAVEDSLAQNRPMMELSVAFLTAARATAKAAFEEFERGVP